MDVVLHYFDCRSRGQAIRSALVASGTDFEDRRVPVAALPAWREKARDGVTGGPFASLPVLDWGDFRIAQTLAVADYLSARLGFDDRFATVEARARDRMIVSAAHLDMQAPYTHLLWLPEDTDDAGVTAVARHLLDVLRGRLEELEAVHASGPADLAFFGGREPTMADYFVFESIDRACTVFGEPFETALAAAPRLAALRRAIASNGELVAYAEAGGVPANVTASPSEPAIRARLAALLAG